MRRHLNLVWDMDKLSVGISDVDEQHQQLFRAVSDLGQSCDEQPMNRERVRGIMQFLWEYSAMHFSAEERYLGHRPEDEAHRRHHRRFVKELELSRRALASTSCSKEQCQALEGWLRTWLLTHVAVEDRALARRQRPAQQALARRETHPSRRRA